MPGRYKVHPLGQAALALGLALSAATASHAAASALKTVPCDRPSVIDLGLAKSAGAVNPGRRIALTVTLPLSNKADLDQFVKNVSNPASPLYGHYLTPAEFASKYGASQSGYASLLAWAKASGLTVTQISTSRRSLGLSGSAAQVQKAFGVKINNYVDLTGKKFYSAATAPKLPAALVGMIHGVYGLSSFAQGHPMNVYLPPAKRAEALAVRSLNIGKSTFEAAPVKGQGAGGTGHSGAFGAQDLETLYQMPSFKDSGKGQSIGFYAEGGIYASDATVYEDYYGLPHTPVIPVSVAGTDTTTPVLGVATEASLDMDMELAMAPHANALYCYEAGTEETFPGSIIDAFTAVADDDKISSLDVSYGLDEILVLSDGGPTAFDDENSALENLAAEGISVFVSAGDNGAYGDLGTAFYPASYNVSDPGSEPLVTGVGGTTLFAIDGIDFLEDTWGELPLVGATGGGVSDIWTLPDYQTFSDGTPLTTFNGGSDTYRNVPDIAAVGDPLTGVDVYTSDTAYIEQPGWLSLGGTSASAPIWAGFTGVVNQQRRDANLPRVGFANPLFYGIYDAANDGLDYNYSVLDFDEVAVGNNGNVNVYGSPGYTAGYGYDNDTGLGSLSGSVLMQDLLVLPPDLAGETGTPAHAPSGFTLVATTPTTASFTWHPVRNAKGYVISSVVPDYYYGEYYPSPVKTTVHPSGTVSGLQPNTTYDVILAAVNPSGGSYDYDDELEFTTPAAP